MKLYRMPLGALGTNCYIVVDESNQHCLVVDPGGEGERLVALLKEKGVQPEAVILTHGHGDHIGGVQAVVDAFKVPVYINKGDEEFLTNSNLNLSGAIGQPVKVTGDIRFIKEDDVIHLGEYSFKVIETPGHTPGGVCFYGEGMVLAGDSLLLESIGRTDFPGSSYEDLIDSVRHKLFTLPEETVVYPGHGPETTIGHEETYNPFFR
ncbi:MAG: MBL fold metallo-hydrolase [Veillonella sp.]|uniref:MBL fold metallo-hydrolase n=1 Tax=Veillonella sp. TaxID=1926307 RepID=UPI0025E061DF|nr:MBL fold metallo-hydrolase [Veillonella sp.]MBE6080269.1 MBL fold metallo-hydrolase [Veillonella sp.]